MKITGYRLHITREDVAAYYELKIKSEERKTFVTVALIMFGIFIAGPLVLCRMLFDILEDPGQIGWLLDIGIILCIAIVVLALCITNNAYRCGRLFKLLQKQNDFAGMVKYVHMLDENDTLMSVAYILHFHQYIQAYLMDEGPGLVIVYEDNGCPSYYKTYDYDKLCDDSENMTLLVDRNGLHLVSQLVG